MNILYLAHRIPYPLNKGEKIRVFHQLKHLAQRHAIHLCTFVDDPDDLGSTTELQKHCASVEVVYRDRAQSLLLTGTRFVNGVPLSVAMFYRSIFVDRIRQKLTTTSIDCLIVSSSSMAQYGSLAPGLPKILDFIDIDSEKWRLYAERRSLPLSLIYRIEARRLAMYEQQMARVFDHSIVVSEDERRVLQSRMGGGAVSVISNGVDLEYFSPSSSSAVESCRPKVVFTGVMDYFPNIDAVQYFCREIFPLVRRVVPDTQFFIVGRNPTRQVRQLQKQMNITVTGAVPDVRPYLANASVAIAPFRLARGVQNKVLEAMAMGVPVVGTAETFKGIAARPQDGIRIANGAASFAQEVIALLRVDEAVRREAGRHARRYVERYHRWEEQGAMLEQVLQQVVWAKTKRKFKTTALA